MIKVGSDFSGVGAFNQALMRLDVEYKEMFACDMDKYARQTFIHNYGEPEYYPTNVYDREIPSDSLDIYMTSPPCQAFSLAGKRLGKDDKRGILFFNSYEFIQVNKPRYFIFENVKGLLSDDGGKPFLNRCDDMIVIHRLVKHETMKFHTMVDVEKIKDRDTGGQQTQFDSPLMFDYNYGLGFTMGGVDAIAPHRRIKKNTNELPF